MWLEYVLCLLNGKLSEPEEYTNFLVCRYKLVSVMVNYRVI
jgi:hypothetical protein